jgi:cytosine/uracil/thiamine/allantoin permease
MPITMAARSKAWTLFARSITGIVGSNATQGVDICDYSEFVLSCV